MTDLAVLLENVVSEVSTRYRFLEINNLIPAPRSLEMQAAVLDALGQINLAPPETSLSLETVLEGEDPRWKVLLYLGTAKNILRTLIFDYTANGFSQSFGEISVENRLSDYQSLHDSIQQEFDDRLTNFKDSQQCKSVGIRGSSLTTSNLLYGSISTTTYFRRS